MGTLQTNRPTDRPTDRQTDRQTESLVEEHSLLKKAKNRDHVLPQSDFFSSHKYKSFLKREWSEKDYLKWEKSNY